MTDGPDEDDWSKYRMYVYEKLKDLQDQINSSDKDRKEEIEKIRGAIGEMEKVHNKCVSDLTTAQNTINTGILVDIRDLQVRCGLIGGGSGIIAALALHVIPSLPH